jgi:hypothetical protein
MWRCCGEHFDWGCDLHDDVDLSRDSLDRGRIFWKRRLRCVELDVAVTSREPRFDDDSAHYVAESVRGRSIRDDHRDCDTGAGRGHCCVHCELEHHQRMWRCCGEHFDWGCDLHDHVDLIRDSLDRGGVLRF